MSDKLKIFLVIDETRFYHPNFVARLIEQTKDEIIGAGLVTKIPPKSNLSLYLKKNMHFLTPSEIFKLAWDQFTYTLKDLFGKKQREGNFFSVRSVFDFYNIDYQDIEDDINQQHYLDFIRSKEPDIIVSSNALIFKEELLKLPKLCCLNRHSGLLPAYRGLWPVFQAVRNGDKHTGVSVHVMGEKLDVGAVLAQEKIKIEPHHTISDLYKECFRVSTTVVLDAIEKVRSGDLESVATEQSPSYYSYPTADHWKEFRKKSRVFI